MGLLFIMHIDIKYKKPVVSTAMSKHPYQSGLRVSEGLCYIDMSPVIKINAFNPKMNDITSHLEMQIPKENVQELIDALNQLK